MMSKIGLTSVYCTFIFQACFVVCFLVLLHDLLWLTLGTTWRSQTEIYFCSFRYLQTHSCNLLSSSVQVWGAALEMLLLWKTQQMDINLTVAKWTRLPSSPLILPWPCYKNSDLLLFLLLLSKIKSVFPLKKVSLKQITQLFMSYWTVNSSHLCPFLLRLHLTWNLTSHSSCLWCASPSSD